MLDKYAEELRKAREEKEITLQQMAAKTRIDIKFLEAIDNGNFSFLPELYVKAFLKQYAKVVGLNEEETVQRYEDAKEGRLEDKDKTDSAHEQKDDAVKYESQEPREEEKIKTELPKDEEKRTVESPVKTFSDVSSTESKGDTGKNKKMIFTAVGSVMATAVVALIVYFLFFKNSSDIIVEEKPYEQVLEQTKERFQVDETEEPQQLVEQITDSLLLQISNIDSSDSVWVLVIYDDKSKEDFMLYPGRTKSVKAANNFKLTLGNSGVVNLKINNSPLTFQGRKRSVRHFKVDSSGIERLYSTPILRIE